MVTPPTTAVERDSARPLRAGAGVRARPPATVAGPVVRRGHRRRRDIQGLRCLAVLLVVLFHAGLGTPGGFIGVDVFFVISGFVITSTLVDELQSSGRIDLPRFYLRRMKRLLPALAAMLLIVTVAGILLDPAGAGRISARTGAFASLFSSNFYLYSLRNGYFAVSEQLNPLLHTWTLGVEEQFYLVFPALLLCAWGVAMRRSGFTSGRIAGGAVIAATAVGSFALALAWSDGSSLGGLRSPEQFAFFSSIARVWEFAAGALLALSVPILRRAPSTFASALGTLGATAIVFGGFAPGSYGGVSTTIVTAVCGAAALIAAGTASRNSVSGLLGSRGPVWVGDLSYSWYLWHWPFIVFARALFPAAGWAAPVAAAVSLAPAWTSYRYLENPIRRSPRVRGWVVPALACTCIALPIIAAAGLARMQSHLPVMSATAQHADVVRGCDDPAPFGAQSRAHCTWQVANALGTVVLVGDSQAGQFTEPVTEAANRARFNATVATLSDCPFVHPSGVLMRNRPCARFSRESLVALVRAKPSLVIIAARTDLYIEGSRAVFTKPTPPAVGPPVSTRLFSEGLRAELAALNRVDVPVIIVHPIPVLHQSPDNCAVVLLLLSRCRGSLSRAAADAELRAARESENRALAGLPSSSSMNFERELCSADTCSSWRPGASQVTYRNFDHLSVAGAQTLEPQFYAAIMLHARSRRR